MRFLIAGGGTGGHVFPGVALAQALQRQDARHEVLFVGTRSGLEMKAIPQAGFSLETIEISGLKGRSMLQIVRALWQLPWAIWSSIQILRRFDPEVVIGVGGYSSGPVLLAAWLLRIPRVVCESNSIPGFTNRVLGRYFVNRVFGTFEKTAEFFSPVRYVLTGNPLRANFMHRVFSQPSENLVLVLGGSLGARPMNSTVPAALAQVVQAVPDLKVIHQTGRAEVELVQKAYERLGVKAEVVAFIEDMPEVYEQARLVVARSGATTCCELTALGVPAILIPFPQAADDHQTENAKELVQAGAAVMLAQKEMTPERLGGMIQHLILNLKSLEIMASRSRKIGRPNAADNVAKKVLELC